MKFVWVLVAIGAIVGVFLLTKLSAQPVVPSQISTSSPNWQDSQDVDITASFTIVTNDVTRNFSAAMYHNLSPDVYIEASDPTTVHTKKKGVTWSNFFNSLPFKLTKDCLTTGTNETFCSGDGGTLRFYLNDLENPNLLEEQIRAGDRALIQFSK